jgi:hypothetical protein
MSALDHSYQEEQQSRRGTALWLTARDAVYRLVATAAGLVCATTAIACGGSALSAGSPAAPTTVSPTPPGPAGPAPSSNGIVISGLETYEPFLLLLERVQLRATRYVDGKPDDCTDSAQWRVVAQSPIGFLTRVIELTGPGLISAVGWGEANIGATCSGATGTIHVRASRYAVRGTLRDVTGRPLSDVDIVGPSGEHQLPGTDTAGQFSFQNVAGARIAMHFSRPGYEPLNATYEWTRTAEANLNLTTKSLGPLIAEGAGFACIDCAAEHWFRVEKPGTIRVDTYVRVACNDYCFLRRDLYCNDVLLSTDSQDNSYLPLTIVLAGSPSCQYRVKFIANYGISYRFGVTGSP